MQERGNRDSNAGADFFFLFGGQLNYPSYSFCIIIVGNESIIVGNESDNSSYVTYDQGSQNRRFAKRGPRSSRFAKKGSAKQQVPKKGVGRAKSLEISVLEQHNVSCKYSIVDAIASHNDLNIVHVISTFF